MLMAVGLGYRRAAVDLARGRCSALIGISQPQPCPRLPHILRIRTHGIPVDRSSFPWSPDAWVASPPAGF